MLPELGTKLAKRAIDTALDGGQRGSEELGHLRHREIRPVAEGHGLALFGAQPLERALDLVAMLHQLEPPLGPGLPRSRLDPRQGAPLGLAPASAVAPGAGGDGVEPGLPACLATVAPP